MVQVDTDTRAIQQVARGADEAAERVRDIVDTLAERAQHELASSQIVDPAEIGAGLRSALSGSEAECSRETQDVRDTERLKAAALAGLVTCALSAVVLVLARRIALRRARVETTTLRPPLTPQGMAVVDDRSDHEVVPAE